MTVRQILVYGRLSKFVRQWQTIRNKRPKGPLSLTWVQWTWQKFWNETKNKRPKGPHNVHLSTMCHLLWWIGQGGNFYSLFSPKNTNLVEDIKILLPVKFRWIPFSGFRGEVENVSANQRRGGHLVFPIGPKNTNLVEGVEILLPVKFHWIPFSGFNREVENVSANQRPARA